MNTFNNYETATLKATKARIRDMFLALPSMHLISENFIYDNMYEYIEDLEDAFYEYANMCVPDVNEEINVVFDSKLVDNYIKDAGEKMTIASGSDFDNLKRACLCHEYVRQLFDDKETIIKSLYLHILLYKIERDNIYERYISKLTDAQLNDVIEGLANSGDNEICMWALSYAIRGAIYHTLVKEKE